MSETPRAPRSRRLSNQPPEATPTLDDAERAARLARARERERGEERRVEPPAEGVVVHLHHQAAPSAAGVEALRAGAAGTMLATARGGAPAAKRVLYPFEMFDVSLGAISEEGHGSPVVGERRAPPGPTGGTPTAKKKILFVDRDNAAAADARCRSATPATAPPGGGGGAEKNTPASAQAFATGPFHRGEIGV